MRLAASHRMIAAKKTAPREEAGICTTGSGSSDVWLGGAIEPPHVASSAIAIAKAMIKRRTNARAAFEMTAP
jgi:hypothetical protein